VLWKWRKAQKGIDTYKLHKTRCNCPDVEMKESPEGHWHIRRYKYKKLNGPVEMKESPEGHWHRCKTCSCTDLLKIAIGVMQRQGGNEEKPEWALTQCLKSIPHTICHLWKWREARMGIDTWRSTVISSAPSSGNEEKPEWALTQWHVWIVCTLVFMWKWREARMGIDTCSVSF